jgi:hypothetical protein
MREKRRAYRVLVRKPERKRSLGEPMHGWKNGIKIYLREMG